MLLNFLRVLANTEDIKAHKDFVQNFFFSFLIT